MPRYHVFFRKDRLVELGVDLKKDIWGPCEAMSLGRKLRESEWYMFSPEWERGPEYERLKKDPRYEMKVVSGN